LQKEKFEKKIFKLS